MTELFQSKLFPSCLIDALCPALRRRTGADVSLTERNSISKVHLIEEVLAALGLASPFDDGMCARGRRDGGQRARARVP